MCKNYLSFQTVFAKFQCYIDVFTGSGTGNHFYTGIFLLELKQRSYHKGEFNTIRV